MHDAEDAIRRWEASLVEPFLWPGIRVLELGPGSGLQAAVLADAGARVTGMEVPGRERRVEAAVPVAEYDGTRLPVADASVDLVYSSSVLEHVVDLDGLLADTARVLAPGGRAVHMVPSTTWRVATILAHYPHLLQELARRRRRDEPQGVARAAGAASDDAPVGSTARRSRLVAEVHGEFPDLRAETAAFRRRAWQARFVRAGWRVDLVRPAGLFYSGYGLASGLSMPGRARLARVLGSSSLVFVVRPLT